jgi:hypothetical protein
MTAVSGELSETAFVPKRNQPQSLHWTEQGFVFEIRSADEKLLEMARHILAVRSPAATGTVARSWTIERAEGSEQWNVSGASETSSMIPLRAGTRDMALLYVEYDALDWLIYNSPDTITVHAALLSKNGKGVVIAGPSFSGKSTLATALWRSGWSLMSDDLVFIDTFARTATPAPRRVSLRFGSKELIGESAWNEISKTPSCVETEKGLFFHPHEVSGREKETRTDLSAIFFLARIDTVLGEAEVRAINPAKGAISLLPYAFNIRTLPFIEGLRRVTPLLDRVPAFDIGRGNLQAMVQAVEVTVG